MIHVPTLSIATCSSTCSPLVDGQQVVLLQIDAGESQVAICEPQIWTIEV